ncbi:hypothetical protein ACGF5M_06345 [Gemmatimonadota bacterium]
MSNKPEHTASKGGYVPPTRESWLSRHGPYLLLLVYLYYCVQVAMELLGPPFGSYALYDMLPLSATSIVVLMVAALVGVVARVVAQVVRRASWTTILRDILGEPSWWRTWYPRILRDSASVWDELPPTLKVTRTAIWLELLLLPAGFVLAVFVLPTFQAVYESIRVESPLMMRTLILAFEIGGYVLPLIILAALVQGWRWRTGLGLPPIVAFNAFFSISQDFWLDTEARQLLED